MLLETLVMSVGLGRIAEKKLGWDLAKLSLWVGGSSHVTSILASITNQSIPLGQKKCSRGKKSTSKNFTQTSLTQVPHPHFLHIWHISAS